ncbi:hypothetical protein FSS13T_10040 [Flavobacterium saliperosum S13]|uniref:TolB-like 6-blade propeller-like n=2 Tax=Flavobacterium saliperosum TaxID=329186 RepID=A0A1G4VX77_9FLAO|nr:hypothetical protein [Flavobacterium saliperosum]ESU26834.1 hypothetical protein FSS13T_10040 [Flavobacterium saliperosum S13]SCX13262.1 hypothetical protein SAMN02927925_01933 [Flavobacterium saliperosum]
MKFTPIKILILGSLFSFGSCSKDDEIKNSDPISSRFGEFVNIPNFDESINISTDFLATDSGLYMTVGNLNDGDDWIYRYNLEQENILNGSWETVQYNTTSGNDYLADKTPLHWNSELLSEHEIFIAGIFNAFETPVYKTLNMSSGNTISQENAPIHNFNPSDMNSHGSILKDDLGQDWAVFRGGTVSNSNLHVVKIRYGNLPFETVCSLTAEGSLYYSTSQVSSNLYALSYQEKKLFIIKPSGQVTTKDLSTYYDSSLSIYGYKNKFRFSNTGVYFQFQDKVLKLVNDENLTLFYTIQYEAFGEQLGDFCVDNDYLFATDGTRKELTGFYSEINIIPSPPNPAYQELLLDHITKTSFFKTGYLETSTDPNDKYIYVMGVDGRILVISKHYINI